MSNKLSTRKLSIRIITSVLVRGQDKQVVWIMPNSKHAVTRMSRVVGSTSYSYPFATFFIFFLIYIYRLYFLLFNNKYFERVYKWFSQKRKVISSGLGNEGTSWTREKHIISWRVSVQLFFASKIWPFWSAKNITLLINPSNLQVLILEKIS